jgi:integrase
MACSLREIRTDVPFQIRTKPGSVTVQKSRSLSRGAMALYKPFVITPQQILATLNRLSTPLYFTLVLTCAATALRASKIVSLHWPDILWSDRQNRISKRWAKGVDGDTKTAASNGYVALHPVLSECLKDWRTQTPHSKVDDFVFPSLLRFGRVPISSPIFGADYLRPSANRGNMAEHIHEEFAALFVFRIALTSSTICSLKAAQN